MDGVRKRVKAPIATVAIGVAVLVAAAPAHGASNPSTGTYKGTIKGGSVRLKVKSDTRARLTYGLKSKCGRAHGTVSLKIKKGRFHSAGRRGAVKGVSGKFVAGGAKAKGTLKTPAGKRACPPAARRFTAKLGSGEAGEAFALSASDFGHYAGTNAAGRPISFDVVGGPGGATVQNLAVDVDTECWDDYDGDGANDALLVHATGFGDEIADNGSFDIYYAPDEDTEFEFSGTIAHGAVDVDVTVGGHFDPDGTPNLTGSFECDNWGETYSAANQT